MKYQCKYSISLYRCISNCLVIFSFECILKRSPDIYVEIPLIGHIKKWRCYKSICLFKMKVGTNNLQRALKFILILDNEKLAWNTSRPFFIIHNVSVFARSSFCIWCWPFKRCCFLHKHGSVGWQTCCYTEVYSHVCTAII